MMMLASRCRCGTGMEPARDGAPFAFCPNCDRTQESEQCPDGKRAITHADRVYHLTWEKLKRQLYTPMTTWPDGGRIE